MENLYQVSHHTDFEALPLYTTYHTPYLPYIVHFTPIAHLITRIDETVKAYSLHFDTLMGMLREEEGGEDALSYLIYRYGLMCVSFDVMCIVLCVMYKLHGVHVTVYGIL
ncbi:hypothetical protein EON63_25045 [archaeon]|nr:MAG: hypothetical protein EON63_25045 [archaeon]